MFDTKKQGKKMNTRQMTSTLKPHLLKVSDLKAGDKINIFISFYGSLCYSKTRTIQKITKRTVKFIDGTSVSKEVLVCTYANSSTKKIIEEHFEKKKIIALMKDTDYDDLEKIELEELRKIGEIIERYK